MNSWQYFSPILVHMIMLINFDQKRRILMINSNVQTTEVSKTLRTGVSLRTIARHSYISRTLWPRITKFYANLHTRRVYNHTGYDVTNYFRSEATATKQSKMPPQTALGWILVLVPQRFASPSIGGLLVKKKFSNCPMRTRGWRHQYVITCV